MVSCTAAYLLLLLGDISDLSGKCKYLKFSFFAGLLLLSGTTIFYILTGTPTLPLPVRAAAIIFSVCFLILTVLSLFGSFPVNEGYGRAGEKRPVYDRKLYALSRHPGVLFLVLFYFSLIPAFGIPLAFPILASILDLALALFEDKVVFPAVLTGYSEYRKSTPFLIPTKKSLRNCFRDFRR